MAGLGGLGGQSSGVSSYSDANPIDWATLAASWTSVTSSKAQSIPQDHPKGESLNLTNFGLTDIQPIPRLLIQT